MRSRYGVPVSRSGSTRSTRAAAARFEALVQRHELHIVYTVHTDTAAVSAALIAVQHALEYLADAIVIPHLGTLEPDTPWRVVTAAADLITGTQEYPLGSTLTAPTRGHWDCPSRSDCR